MLTTKLGRDVAPWRMNRRHVCRVSEGLCARDNLEKRRGTLVARPFRSMEQLANGHPQGPICHDGAAPVTPEPLPETPEPVPESPVAPAPKPAPSRQSQ